MTGRRLLALFADQPMIERFDRVIEVLLISLLAFGPLALGVVHAWSEQVVIALAALISLIFLLKLSLFKNIAFVWSWAYVPISVFVLVAALQLMPLPSSIMNVISPNTASLRQDLLGDLPNAREVLSSMTLSFYPHATRHDLRLVLAAAAVFVVVVNLYRQPERIKRLLAAIAIIGGGFALLALMQDLAGNGKIYWLVPTYDKGYSGTFINHSHYGQFMNLSIGAALGLLFVTLHEAFTGHRVTPARVAEYLSSPAGKTVKILLAMMMLGAATVFISLTRGGMVGMLIAAGFTTLMLSWRESLKGRGWIMVLLALGAFICILYAGFDQVYDRLATLREFNRAEGSRWQIVRDIALAWTRFPVFGAGLGTHEVVYPMFDRSTIASMAMHAENEYAQAAEETGIVGLLALSLLGVGVWVSYARSVNVGSVPIRSAAYGLGFGLLAILIHSLSDFGQHLPANAMLSAVCCGLLIALDQPDREPERCRIDLRRPAVLYHAWRPMALFVAVGVSIWAMLGANGARIAQGHWSKTLVAEQHLQAGEWWAPQEAYEYLFTHATAAAKVEPDNIQYQHWLGVYKWLSLTPYADPNTQQLPPEALPWVRQIVQELHQARPLCPTFGALYCVIGEIEQFVLGDPSGAERIRKGYRLAPCDATACFAAGQIAVHEGKPEDAFAKVARAVQLDKGYFQRAVRLYANDLNRGDLALQLAGNDAGRLAYVGNLLASLGKASEPPAGLAADHPPNSDDRQQLAEEAQVRAFEQLKQRCEEPGAPASAHASLANLYRQQGNLEAAIQHYQRAARLDYAQIAWHYSLAQLLAQVNRVDEAMHEAQICLRLRSDYAPAKKLMKDLDNRPVAPKQTATVGG